MLVKLYLEFLLLWLSHATDSEPIALIAVADTGARTIEVQEVRVATTVHSRRPVAAARPASVEGVIVIVVAGIDAEEGATSYYGTGAVTIF